MSIEIFIVVLGVVLLYVSWNVLVKFGIDCLVVILLMVIFFGVILFFGIFFVGLFFFNVFFWLFLLVVFYIGYCFFFSKVYE